MQIGWWIRRSSWWSWWAGCDWCHQVSAGITLWTAMNWAQLKLTLAVLWRCTVKRVWVRSGLYGVVCNDNDGLSVVLNVVFLWRWLGWWRSALRNRWRKRHTLFNEWNEKINISNLSNIKNVMIKILTLIAKPSNKIANTFISMLLQWTVLIRTMSILDSTFRLYTEHKPPGMHSKLEIENIFTNSNSCLAESIPIRDVQLSQHSF